MERSVYHAEAQSEAKVWLSQYPSKTFQRSQPLKVTQGKIGKDGVYQDPSKDNFDETIAE